MRTHRLFTDGDGNIPEQILDRNGQVVLSCCKFCGKAEAELSEPCTPDFEALRAQRNQQVAEAQEKLMKELAIEFGEKLSSVKFTNSFNPNDCYCACGSKDHGPCEHDWDGPVWTSDDGCAASVTCSRCGTTAMSHDMRVLP